MNVDQLPSVGDVNDRRYQASHMRRIARMLVSVGLAMVVLGLALVLWQ